MDNLGAIAGPLLALALVNLVGTRTAIFLSIIPGLLAALAIVYAIRHARRAEQRERQPLRLRIRPLLTGRLGRLMVGVSASEFGNVAATLLRGFEPLTPCMPSRDPRHSAHHEPSRSRALHQRRRAVVWWFARLREQSCCASAARNRGLSCRPRRAVGTTFVSPNAVPPHLTSRRRAISPAMRHPS
jgi:hypothetical protein